MKNLVMYENEHIVKFNPPPPKKRHCIASVRFDIICICDIVLKCQFGMFCQDIYFIGLVGNHGENNPIFAREKTNKKFGEKHSKASQTLSNLHL